MNNCWGWAVRRLLDDVGESVLIVRPTRKAEWGWRLIPGVETIVVWAVLAPAIVLLNLGYFLLRGKWLHVAWARAGDPVCFHYVPEPGTYRPRRSPPVVFRGVVRSFRFPEPPEYNGNHSPKEN